jgi:peptidoglycan hydrolase CwlO-like protein|tara:strand:- start:274 stop:489 length:216 start_codon:yes stop_codon:yes gene_type:complete
MTKEEIHKANADFEQQVTQSEKERNQNQEQIDEILDQVYELQKKLWELREHRDITWFMMNRRIAELKEETA